jgi:N-hydroxyarylamine O-acetyltransferase
MHRTLDSDLIDEILARLGIIGRPAVNYAGLAELYHHWCRNIPFDNLFKILFLRGNENIAFPGSNDVLFFRNWLKYGTGGTCWGGNGALQILLVTLGFNAKRRRGSMLVGQATAPDHGSVTVELGESVYLVDASILHDEPLELHPQKSTGINNRAWGVTAQPDGDDWLIWWRPLHLPEGCFCRIENTDIDPQEWLARNRLTRTVSPFNDSLYVRKIIGDDVVGVEYGARTVFDSAGRVVREILTHNQMLTCLADEMGFATELLARLPADDSRQQIHR